VNFGAECRQVQLTSRKLSRSRICWDLDTRGEMSVAYWGSPCHLRLVLIHRVHLQPKNIGYGEFLKNNKISIPLPYKLSKVETQRDDTLYHKVWKEGAGYMGADGWVTDSESRHICSRALRSVEARAIINFEFFTRVHPTDQRLGRGLPPL
jgi:hypothetical protein